MKRKGIGHLKSAALTVCAAMTASSLSVCPGMTIGTAASESDRYLCGDVLVDGTVGPTDSAELSKSLVRLTTLDDMATLGADANLDGEVNVADMISIMSFIVMSNRDTQVGDYVMKDGTPDEITLAADCAMSDAVSESTNAGFTGSSYVNFANQKGSALTYKLSVETAGVYKLRIRYANGGDADRSMYASVNGSKSAATVSFPSTGSWENWSISYSLIKLEAGENEITFISATDEGGPNIDTITACQNILIADAVADMPGDITIPDTSEPVVEPTTTTTVTAPVTTTTTVTEPAPVTTTTTTAPVVTVERYYAIEADYYDGWEENTNAGFAGEGYFNYNNAVGSYVEWTVEVPEAGNYQVDFRYANGTDADRVTKLTVNGAKECYYMSFLGTGAWTTWATNSVVLELKAGTNKIKAYATTANGGPNMDYIELKKTDASAVEMVTPKDGRQVENLNRGVSAAYTGSGVLVSWRILATDDPSTTFDLWKNGETKLGTFTLEQASCYLDTAGTATDWYTIDTFVNGEMTEFAQVSRNLSTKSTGQSGAYFDIPLQKPAAQTMPDGTTCTYNANDATVADADGDGEYEIYLKWDPSNSKDNSKDGYTGTVFIDCYKLDGTLMWRVDLGKNIRAGAHYTQMMVYDYDGDGKAEMVCKTADGTKDGQGTVIGDASADYRASNGYILSGPEYLTLFDGETGKALHTIDYKIGRGNVSDWGDNYGNRVDRFTAATAYLDGKTPSVIMNRGYYTRMTATAYNVVNDKLVEQWTFDTGNSSSAAGYHDGNHNCMPADVDGDGKDEIVMGSAVIDDNGKLLYTSGMEHGDAMHVGDLVPDNPGIEIFMCHEGDEYGVSLRDGETGNIIFRSTGTSDTGRCLAGNFIASNPGAEFVGIHNSIVYNSKMEQIATWADVTKWNMNSLCYWTGALERGTMDRLMVDQHGSGRVFTGEASYNNDSKSNVSLSADIFGDWREEIIAPANDSAVLRVFGTTFTTEYPIYTLMHDTQYRAQVAGQNVGYNQPPHPSFYLGSDTGTLPAFPNVYEAE